jgi:hypothetical protein
MAISTSPTFPNNAKISLRCSPVVFRVNFVTCTLFNGGGGGEGDGILDLRADLDLDLDSPLRPPLGE